ncbi:hypothetical protein Tco_1304121 [Tanacetum coccineum]
MTSPNKPTSKPSMVAKMSVKPIWRKKLNPCNTSNELNVSSPTPMPKPLTPHHEPSQENNHPNQALPNPYIKDTPMLGFKPITLSTAKRRTVRAEDNNARRKLLARKNELKAKITLLLAIPDEYLLKFHGIKDAKTLWEAIKARFGGNKELKKTQKTILKQQYENFAASRSEGLDKTYDRF